MMEWLRLFLALSILVNGARMLLRPRSFVGPGSLDATDPRTVKIFGWASIVIGLPLLGASITPLLSPARAGMVTGLFGGWFSLILAIVLVSGGALAFLFHQRLDDPTSIISGKMTGVILLGFGLVSFCIFLVETF
jgi:hypothetical protein